MTKRKTTADRARDLHRKHPELTRTELARRLGTSPQAVDNALKRHPNRGRPPVANEMRLQALASKVHEAAVNAGDEEAQRLANQWLTHTSDQEPPCVVCEAIAAILRPELRRQSDPK